MGVKRAEKEGSSTFHLVVSMSVFTGFLMVFLFVEVKNIQAKGFIAGFVATIILTALLMLLGILTLFPGFSTYFGRTMIVFSILILLGVMLQAFSKGFSIFYIIEIMLSITSFLYGRELLKQGDKFISLNAAAGNTAKKRG